MPEPGGGGRVGGPPNPPSAQQIIQDLFGGDQQKKLDSQQQAQQLRDQARTQTEMRDTSQAQKSAEEGHGEGVRREGETPRARQAGRSDASGLVREKDIDAFLSRSSSQQTQREAGKQLSRPQTMGSINAQAWTVANSPNTPETARTLLQGRQQSAQQGTQLQQPRAQGGTLAQQPGTTPRPVAQLVRPGMPLPNLTPALIRYAGQQSGGETAARAFTGRPLPQMDQFGRQVQRLVQEQLGRTAQQSFTEAPQVAVHQRGNIFFVRDGNKTRAFKLDKEGNLSELPSEDAGDQPLSPEAQKLLQKVLRQKGLHAKMEGKGAEHAEVLSEKELGELQREQAKLEEAHGGEALDFETRFALLLHEVLEENRELGEALKGDPAFPTKADWEAFFARMMKMGNHEKALKKSTEDILNMIFRGLFKKKGSGGNILVGDLKYLKQGKTKEEKFAQVSVSDAKLLEMLNSLKPGQKIGKEVLGQFFGEELSFLQMAHLTERLFNMASSAEKNVVFNPKAHYDQFGQARLERSLLSSRKEPKGERQGHAATPNPLEKGVPANTQELMALREQYQGRPKLYTVIFYAFGGLLLLLVLLFILIKSS